MLTEVLLLPLNATAASTRPWMPSTRYLSRCLMSTPPSLTTRLLASSTPGFPPSSSNLASTRLSPVSSDLVESQQPPSSTTGDLCLLFGVGYSPSSTPVSSDPVPTRSPVSSEPSESTKLSISPDLLHSAVLPFAS